MASHLGGARVADTTPYAWPYDGDLEGAATAVLVIQPSSPWQGTVDEAAFVAAAEVAKAVETAGGQVLSLRTAHPPSHVQGSPTPGLPVGEKVFGSAGIDGFYASGLEAHLRRTGVKRLLLVGLGSETSIHSTMRTANDMGFECLFVTDACQPYDPSLTPHTVSMIEMSGGIFGAVGTASAVVAAFDERNQS